MARNLFGGGIVSGRGSRSSPFGGGTLGGPLPTVAPVEEPAAELALGALFLDVNFATDTHTFQGAPITIADIHTGRTLSPVIAARTVPGEGLKTVITDVEFSQNSATFRFNDAIQAIFEQGFIFVMDFEQIIDGVPTEETDYCQAQMICYAGPDTDGYYAFGAQTNAGLFVLSAFLPDYVTAQEAYAPYTYGDPSVLALSRAPGESHRGTIDGAAFDLGTLANDNILPQLWHFYLFSDTYTPGTTLTQIIRSLKFYLPA